jgi:type IV pilus assembly protein PilA
VNQAAATAPIAGKTQLLQGIRGEIMGAACQRLRIGKPGSSTYDRMRNRVLGFVRTKLQLELLRTLRQRKGTAKGFTLIELMIVVAIIAILSAVALPAFLGTRSSASAGSAVGEIVGLAKECAVYLNTGGASGNAPDDCTVGVAASFSRSWSGTVANLKCLTADLSTTATKATISVATDGTMTCAFTNGGS